MNDSARARDERIEKRVRDRIFNISIELDLADSAEARAMFGAKDKAVYFALRHMDLIRKIPVLKNLAYRVFKSIS